MGRRSRKHISCPAGGLPQPRRLGGRWRYPAGGLPSLPPANLAFSLIYCPHPPNPRPRRGRGRLLVFLCKGLRPLHPRGWMGRGTGSTCVSGTLRVACPICRLPPLTLVLILPPSPQPPSPPGKGETFSFLMQGAPPLASPGLDGTRHWLDLRLAVPGGGACPICRLPPLPLALPFAPIPPTRARRALFPSGEGGDF